NPVADVVAGWFDFFMKHLLSLGWQGATLHDPCAVLTVIYPELFEFKDLYVEVELNGQYTRGATVPDYYGLKNHAPNVQVAMNIDREKFIEILINCCRYYSEEKEQA
ncbi:MAG: pyrimidine-specific ribonucleoside hydrolase RihA, partial [Erysipelothrix sp.]|nr:pyrimidine-specific ribonucleoside hydrolase RihA [Erysipelothrix sp.]